jgi:endonuclease/exonuclease/phosphatase family metal-dependent hydrolase
MVVVVATLNVGLQRAQAQGRNQVRRFQAIAGACQQAFEVAGADIVGLSKVGDAITGLAQQEANLLVDIIRQAMPQQELYVHADARDQPYMLLSKVDGHATVTDVQILEGFCSQRWRKALTAKLGGAGSLPVEFWLVHLASSNKHRLIDTVRKETLAKLLGGNPVLLTGDICSSEVLMRQWIRDQPTATPFYLAGSSATNVRKGDYTLAANCGVWSTECTVGRSFDLGKPNYDCTSDLHDMVCVTVSTAGDAAQAHSQPEEAPNF